jgi:hypothetical protein
MEVSILQFAIGLKEISEQWGTFAINPLSGLIYFLLVVGMALELLLFPVWKNLHKSK